MHKYTPKVLCAPCTRRDFRPNQTGKEMSNLANYRKTIRLMLDSVNRRNEENENIWHRPKKKYK